MQLTPGWLWVLLSVFVANAQAQTLTANPDTGEPGDPFVARGTGYAVTEVSLLLRDGVDVVHDFGVFPINARSLDASLLVPDVDAGTYDLVSFTGRATVLARTTLTVEDPPPPPPPPPPSSTLRLLPPSLPQGSELLAFVVDQPAGGVSELRFDFGDGTFAVLETLDPGATGDLLIRTPLPDVDPGFYTIELNIDGLANATATLTVTPGPSVTFDPGEGFPGQQIAAQFANLEPGLVRLKLDDQLIMGPFSAAGSLTRFFAMPAGEAGTLDVELEVRVGDRIYGSTQTTIERLGVEQTEVESMSVMPLDEPMRRRSVSVLRGQVGLPDGATPENYLWTLVLRKPDGRMWPINMEPFEFTAVAGKGGLPSGLFDYAVKMTAPSLLSGFPFVEIDREVDEVGVVYQRPQIGEDGEPIVGQSSLAAFLEAGYVTLLPAPLDFEDEQGVVISGRVTDGTNPDSATNGIEGAIVAVETTTELIFPSQIGQSGFDFFDTPGSKIAADQTKAVRSVGALLLETQISQALLDLAAPPPLATGCPQTLDLKATNANGEYEIAFHPDLTNLLQGFHIGRAFLYETGSVSSFNGENFPEDRFIVRISGLHLDDAFGIPSTLDLSSFTGVRYDFERTGPNQYFLCANFDENCAGGTPFLPTSTLVTKLQPAPSGVTLELQSEITIDGLPPAREEPGCLGLECPKIFDGLLTFPLQADNPSINQESLTMAVNWAPGLFGVPDGVVVTLDGIAGSFPLLTEGGNSCTPGKIVYSGEIPGLAVLEGPIMGQVQLAVGDTLFLKRIQINTEPGPTWFEGQFASRYQQPVNLIWSPHEVSIFATEVKKEPAQSASTNVNQLDVGQVDNINLEEGTTLKQKFMVGGSLMDPPTRAPQGNVTVINEGGEMPLTSMKLGPQSAYAQEVVGIQRFPHGSKGSVANLLGRSDPPTEGSEVPTTLFQLYVPLFRYVWGAAPIAAAVLGSDLLVGANLLYLAYIETTATSINVDSATVPSSFAILNVFFDFSAIFGLVNISLSASPEIATGLPLVIIDSMLDAAASQPCFEFLLRLTFEVSVGVCPLCLGGSFSDTPIDLAKPANCTVGALAKTAPKISLAPPSADSIGLATNGLGTTMAAFSESEGMTVQLIEAGMPGPVYNLDAGAGAMQPEVAFYGADEAVAVWAQSSLSQTEFDLRLGADWDCTAEDVAADPNCNDQEQFDATQFQHLVFSTWDGMDWSATQALTVPTTGEGGVRLAACPESDAACGGGKVLAVWHRDMAADLTQHQIKLYYAIFDGVAWSPAAAIDPGLGSKDVQPAPVFLEGEPVVVFVRNSSPVDNTGGVMMGNRALAYRFLDVPGASTQLVPNTPAAIASPSAQAVEDALYVTFTSSAPTDPFAGTRRALYVATGFNCSTSTGTCQIWLDREQKDQHGRTVYAEEPRLVVDGNGVPSATFRWLGTGGEYIEGDPIGTFGLGDSAMMVLALPDSTVTESPVNFMTNDGLVNWQTAAIYDSAVNSVLAISAQADGGVQAAKLGFTAQPMGGTLRRKLAASRPLTGFQAPAVPDLALLTATPEIPVVVGADVLRIEVTLANLGMPVPDGESFAIDAWWDGPAGVGTLVGSRTVQTVSEPAGTTLTFGISVPDGVTADSLHALFVTVNADGAVTESDGDNNVQVITFNALPAPPNVDYLLDAGGTTAVLQWDDPVDDRVSTYRVYRREFGTTDVIQAGLSPRLGFVDMLSEPGATYEYCVASMSDTMMEGACSPWLLVPVKAIGGNVIFRAGFEPPRR